MLLVGGLSYRVAMARLRPLAERRILLPVPLSEFPLAFAGWTGQDRPLTAAEERIAGNDDYLSRLYANPTSEEWANLYIAYSARPRTMVGHQPQVCMTNAGWISDGFSTSDVVLGDGSRLPVLIHRFHQTSGLDVVILNYYILNGETTNDESAFAGVGWRLPNIHGNPAYYVAQVQVSSRSEAAVRHFAALTAPEILSRLPDSQGQVEAALRQQASVVRR